VQLVQVQRVDPLLGSEYQILVWNAHKAGSSLRHASCEGAGLRSPGLPIGYLWCRDWSRRWRSGSSEDSRWTPWRSRRPSEEGEESREGAGQGAEPGYIIIINRWRGARDQIQCFYSRGLWVSEEGRYWSASRTHTHTHVNVTLINEMSRSEGGGASSRGEWLTGISFLSFLVGTPGGIVDCLSEGPSTACGAFSPFPATAETWFSVREGWREGGREGQREEREEWVTLQLKGGTQTLDCDPGLVGLQDRRHKQTQQRERQEEHKRVRREAVSAREINTHQYPSIPINIHQYPSIPINILQYPSIPINIH